MYVGFRFAHFTADMTGADIIMKFGTNTICTGCNDMALPAEALRIGYFGKEGSYTDAAARSLYQGEFSGYRSIQDLFAAASDGEVDFGVVPIENSVEGSVGLTNDLLHREELFIVAETYSKISHCLIARPGTRMEDVEGIISHPQALGQCSSTLHRLGLNTVPFPDTATAVASLKDEAYARYAAIGNEMSAKLYGMEILQRDISDFPDNYTRFVSVSRKMASYEGEKGNMKASIVVSLAHEPGSLKKILEIFSQYNLNLTRIESRPVKFSPWRYIFFLDSLFTTETITALKKIEEASSAFKLLGIYPMAELPLE